MNENIKLHDIKDLTQIPDYSIFIFYSLIILAFLLIISILVFIYKYFKKKKNNPLKQYFKELENIDYSNSKDAAYTITKNLRLLSRSQREKKLALEIIEKLDKYKYKKEVKNIDEDIKTKLSIYLGIVDV